MTVKPDPQAVQVLSDLLDKHAAKHLPDDASDKMRAAAAAYMAAVMIYTEAKQVAQGVRDGDSAATPERIATMIENMAETILNASEAIMRLTETTDRLRARLAEAAA